MSAVDGSPLRQIMPLLWNSKEDIFLGTLAPPGFFLHLTKKLDMSYSEINQIFY